jgi:hypothetical protein
MSLLAGKSRRQFTPLPIDNARGYPQSFIFGFLDHNYHFRLYVNISAELLDDRTDFIELPSRDAFLVVQVERELTDGARQIIFLRKVVPDLEYEAENIVMMFPRQLVARNNLNGQGDFGSQVVGGIARRWA